MNSVRSNISREALVVDKVKTTASGSDVRGAIPCVVPRIRRTEARSPLHQRAPPSRADGGARALVRSARLAAMTTARSLALSLALFAALAALVAPAPDALARVRRQLADDNTLQPIDDATSDDQAREKRKLEGITEAKFGVKNAILGFVFGKINSLIDSKTRLVETLDRKNIEINKQYGIEAPKDGGLASLSGFVGQIIGPKLQLLGPKIQAVSGLLGGASGGSSHSGGGSGLGSILSLVTSLSGSSSGGAAVGGTVETIDSSEESDS
ncbi:unnamed protein product [Euphydryas editha]|uniref:Uncharacterized protein n=1 Tax=Euphydryas editha TaxID=104508 RepID=A0AAU9U5C3_EUPED|nr:unnamed protein product [Euphydryas editha]